MSKKNKAEVNKGIKSGNFNYRAIGYFDLPAKDPLMFANSDELRKIQNRNRKK
jgi:hypothetical protein